MHELDHRVVGDTMFVGQKVGLNKKKYRELVNLLRMNLLYQTPVGIHKKENGEDGEPDFIGVRFVPKHYIRLMQLIGEHGGWALSKEQREEIERNAADSDM